MIGLSNGRDAGFGRRAGPARQAVQWWTSPSGRRTRVRGPVENDASMEIRKQRGFPQAPRLRRISHRPDGGNASPSTCFQAATIHLKIGNLLSEEWGHPQGLSLYSILATAKIGPLQQAPTGTKAHHQAPLSRLMFLLENALMTCFFARRFVAVGSKGFSPPLPPVLPGSKGSERASLPRRRIEGVHPYAGFGVFAGPDPLLAVPAFAEHPLYPDGYRHALSRN